MGTRLQLSEFTTDECMKLSFTAFMHLPREAHAAVPLVGRYQRGRFSRGEESGVVLPGKITPAARS